MGEIVAAVGTCHTPYLLRGRRREAGAARRRGGSGCRRSATFSTRRAGCDRVLRHDHVEIFRVTCIPTFRDHAGSRAIARFAAASTTAGSRDLAEDLRPSCGRSRLRRRLLEEPSSAMRRRPVRVCDREAHIPIVPFLHQRVRAPLPIRGDAPRWQGRGGDHRRAEGRVAVIASGGMSHFSGDPQVLSPGVRLRSAGSSRQFETGTPSLLN